MSFRHDPLVGFGIFYLAIKSQMFNRSRVVKLLTVIQQPILKLDNYNDYEYIMIRSEYKSSNFVSPFLFDLSAE
jgi:hypothetical protein